MAAPHPSTPADTDAGRGDHAGAALGLPALRLALGLTLAYAGTAWATIEISRLPGHVATLWYANAMAAAMLLVRPWRQWPLLGVAVAVAITAANLLGGDSLGRALLFVPPNLAEVLLAAAAMRRAGLATSDLRRPRDMLLLLLLGAGLPPLVGATLGAATIALLGAAPFDQVWLPWFEGSAIGSVGMLPLASLVLRDSPTMLRQQMADPRLWAATSLATGITLLVMAWLPFPFVVMALPLLGAAMVLEPVAVALVAFATSLAGAVAISVGLFVSPPVIDDVQQIFVYLAFASSLVPAQLLAAAMADMRDSHARLATRERELGRANQGLEQFVHMASHDLREPVNTIAQFGRLLETDDAQALPPPARRYLQLVNLGAERLRALLDDVLHFARVQRGGVEDLRPVPLDEVLRHVQAALHARIARRSAQLQVGPLPVVRGQAQMLELLFQNLLSNAVKFVPPDRVPQVQVTARRRGDEVGVTVQDNGIGMAEADLPKLFKPFQRLHLRREYEGTGLGLALALQVAQAHGGRIEVASTPGAGSRFTVWLPLALGEETPLLR